MFAKLASRNVKRQVGNYLIYFITVSLTIALMFAVNNVIFSDQLQQRAADIGELKAGLIAITIFISLIVAFVLGYATSFMLKLRKREFGTYLTLGMTRQNILFLFILETMFLCAAALGVGILLGLFVYQGLMAIISHLIEMEFTFATYSVQGLILTVALVVGVFLLSSATSAVYLKRVSIYQLLHGDRVVQKKVRFPILWGIVTLASLAVIVGSCVVFDQELQRTFYGEDNSGGGMFSSILVLAVAVILFHIGLAKSIVNLMLKNRRFCSRGTNTFVLRQLSGKMNANSVMAGILAFLVSFAVIGANVSFVMKVTEQAALEKAYPFDISIYRDKDSESPIGIEEGESIISRYATIKQTYAYSLYTQNTNDLHRFTDWSGEGYGGLYDTFISESDFNRIYTALGYDPITLNGGFMIYSDLPQIKKYDFSRAQLPVENKTYPYGGMLYSQKSLFQYSYFVAVVPDEAVKGMTVATECRSYDLVDEPFDVLALQDALSYTRTIDSESGAISYQRCDYFLKEYSRLERNHSTAIFVLGALYIAVVFVFMVMAILALKTLSSLSEDQKRYRILFRLGAGEKEQSKALFRQTFSFFFLPFALPILLSVPTAAVCGHIMSMGGFPEQVGEVYGNAGLITLVITVIYVLYFIATYLVAKRNTIDKNA